MPQNPDSSLFYLHQIQTLQKLNQANQLINTFKQKIAYQILRKQQDIKIDIPKQLKEKCMTLLNTNHKVVYKCEHCDREFSDGRQLGGHVSKAHKKVKQIQVEPDCKMEVENQNKQKVSKVDDIKFKQDMD